MRFVRKVIAQGNLFTIFFVAILALMMIVSENVGAAQQGLTDTQLKEYDQNHILFYKPGECLSSGGSGTICGSTAREKYWSALGKYFDDPIQKAGIMGSVSAEGQFSPTSWQCGNGMDSGGNFVVSWDTMFNPSYSNPTYIGVGGFGITSGLSTYLNWINDNTPNSIQYLKDPVKYAYNWCRHDSGYETPGDQTLEVMGAAAFDELVEHEVEYAMTKFNNTVTEEYKNENFSTPSEAASWWARYWEVGEDYLNPRATRLQEAEKAYDELKDFKCTASSSSGSSGSSSSNSSSSSQVSGNDITWIGDSYSENSTNKAAVESKYPGIYYNGQSGRMFANDSSRWGSSGLNILKNEIKENLRDYLVFALGTNTDAGSKDTMAKNIDDLVATAKKYNSNTKIILVSPITNNDSARKTYDAYREAMQEAVKKYDNVILADWYDVAKDHLNEYFDDHSTGGYTDKSTHPNAKGYEKWIETISNALSSASGNGCTTYEGKYPQYNQCGDSRWSDHPYGTDNICGSGCGAASMAMLATVATGQDIFPNDIADLLGNQYYDSVSIATLDPIVGKHYGFEVETVSVSGIEDTKTKLRDYLKKGYMIHFTGRGCYPGFIYSSGDCTKGHVIGLFDIDDNDMVTQANSGMGEVHQKASLDDMAKALNFGIFTAIKGSNSSKNNCDDLCQSKNVSMAGLTEEQAQKLADYYNGPDVDADEYGLPFGKTNCVSFSMWFTKAIAGLSWASGNGRDVAHAVAEEHNLSEGKEPRPYAIFSVTKGISYCGEALCGHTGIVVAVNGDEVLTVEAAYPSTPAYVTKRDRSYFENTVYQNTFTYLDSSIDQSKLKNIVGN